jgi:hypothetical protein
MLSFVRQVTSLGIVGTVSVALLSFGPASEASGTSGYLVVLARTTSTAAVDTTRGKILSQHAITPRHVWRSALSGFSADLSAQQAAALAQTPGVVSLAPDGLVPLASAERKWADVARQPEES